MAHATRFLTVLVLALGAMSCTTPAVTAAAMKPDRERDELVGPVQKVSERFVPTEKDQYGQIDDRDIGSTTYDRAGNMTELVEVTPDFIRTRTVERKDARTVVLHSVMGDATISYEVDARGNVTRKSTRYGIRFDGKIDEDVRYKYDAGDRVIEADYYLGDDKIWNYVLYTRDADGHITVEEPHLNHAKPPYPRMYYTYQYDAHGNWTVRSVRRENIPADSHEFGHAGNIVRTITYFE